MARTFHTDDRTFSNFQPAELVKLCGVNASRWPVYILKELLDNAVAACEDHGVRCPVISVRMDPDGLTVSDPGPGMTDDVLDKVLDFTRFGGSNRHYKLPTRGAQGNALMTIVGISSAWSGWIEISRRSGPTVRVVVQLDTVRQEVHVSREEVGPPGQSSIRVWMPTLPWKRGGSTWRDVEQTLNLFALVNPSASFMIRGGGQTRSIASVPGAMPILYPMPVSGRVEWFTDDEFAERLGADLRARPNVSFGEWASEFLGCRRTGVDDLGVGIDDPLGWMDSSDERRLRETSRDLRAALVAASDKSPVKFNGLGRSRMADILVGMGADRDVEEEYATASGTFSNGTANVPFLVEVATRQVPQGGRTASYVFSLNRTVLYNSPQFDELQWRDKVRGAYKTTHGDLGSLCQAYQLSHGDTPAMVAVHVVCPSPGYSGYGKQSFDTSWLAAPLSEAMERATLEIRKLRAGESRRRRLSKEPQETIKDTIFMILPGILARETEGGKLPILIRNLYYAVRGVWERYHDKELQYATFCAYVDLYERSIGRPVCLKDPRGTLIEPHSGREFRLGTDAIARYEPKMWEGHTIIFVEKEGFAHLLKAYKILKRYDAIVVASKGFAVEACREVLQKYRKLLKDRVKIVALHDADPAGYMIGYDLATNLPRFGENVDVQVIDVGLTISDAQEMGLQDEPFDLSRPVWTMVRNMRHKFVRTGGVRRPMLDDAAWHKFMPVMYQSSEYPTWADNPRGRRVELNAMSPRVFINWLEGKLDENECKKVRPPDDVVDEVVFDSRERAIKGQVGASFMRVLGDDIVIDILQRVGLPGVDLDALLAAKPEQHWEYLCQRAGEIGADVESLIDETVRERLGR